MNDPSGLEFAFQKAPMQATKTQRKQPVQKRSQITCDAIVEATIQVLLRDGAARLTTTRVADRAGVSVGTLYQYYPNKSALIEAVRARYFGLMSTAVQTIIGQGTDGSLEQVMDQALTAVIAMKQQNLPLSRALAELPGDPDQPDFSAEVVRHFAEFVLPMLSQGAQPTADQRSRALATMAALEGLLSYAVKNAPHWLSEPWFLSRAKALARSGLSDVSV